MLKTIALLGKASPDDALKSIVDKTDAKHVFVIQLNKDCKYVRLTVENNEGEERYLYKRKMGGLPGEFITGRIGAVDLKKLKKNLQILKKKPSDNNALKEVDTFKKKKIAWVQKPSILRNNKAIEKIPPKSANLLKSIVEEIVKRQDKIMKELSELVLHQDYDEVLLTVKIGQRYLSDIEGFPELLRIAAQGVESIASTTVASRCMICNQQSSGNELKEPLPFFTIDKPNFIPDGMLNNAYKVFSLCRGCYVDLQKGSKYIKEKLAFPIPKTTGDSKLWLWLVPQLNDPKLVDEYVRETDNNLASFKQMLQISEGMETARDLDLSYTSNDTENDSKISNFLTYIALFHTYDKQKHMRLVSAVDGIYPARLRELSLAKKAVDKVAFRNRLQLKFHFGLITDLIENDNDGWMKLMTYIMSNIFTRKPIDELLIARIILSKARSVLSKRELYQWRQIMLNATLILEYLYKVGSLSAKTESQGGFYPLPSDEKAAMAANFLNSHQNLLYTKNLRAICAIGIAVGVVINAQKRYLGSDSFINRLNRLEMDYPRLRGLFSQAYPKLKHYKAEEYNELFAYLGANEISNLDPNQQVQKELMNLVFAVGMAFGFTIGPKKEDKSQ